MPNLQTSLDMLGALIDPRAEDEPLHEYKTRLPKVAESMAKRSFVSQPGEPTWREAREKELEGRVGAKVKLEDGSGDPDLVREADDRLLTWDNIDEKGTVRWPIIEPRGKSPRYGVGTAEKGGVASPQSLNPHPTRLIMEPGYVLADGRLWYMPGDLKVLGFQLPPNTQETVLVPWNIYSQHPHRIEIENRTRVRLVGEDGHEHIIEAENGEEPKQAGYNRPAGTRAQHAHDIEHVHVRGPVFAQTRPSMPTSNTGGGELSVTDGESIAPGRPAEVPHLSAQMVKTNEDANLDHVHEAMVSPHDYWSGYFTLPGEEHSHEVEDWVVQSADGHTHTLNKPTIPDNRSLVPRLTQYEDKQLLQDSNSPFVMNVRVEEGWVVGSTPDGFTEALVMAAETGGVVQPPTEPLYRADEKVTLGLGPDLDCDQLQVRVLKARNDSPILLHIRAEDKYTGGVPQEKITVKWESGARSLNQHTNDRGATTMHIPTSPDTSKTVYQLTITSESGCTEARTIDLDGPIAEGGFGHTYGDDYGD